MKLEVSTGGKLTKKQEDFFRELQNPRHKGSVASAARSAGYAPSSANSASAHLLKNPIVLQKLAFSEVIPNVDRLATHETILTELITLYRSTDSERTKVTILDLLGKYRGMWEKQETKNQVLNIINEITRPAESPDKT